MPYGSSGDVYVLADKYGRVLVEHVEDGDYYRCVAWVDGETRFDFDSASDTELVTQMLNRGFVEGLTIGENLDVTVNIGGLTETYVWDGEKAEFDYDFDSWVNGSRTLTTKWFAKSDGSPELVVVDTANETPVYFVDGAGTQRCLVVEYPGDDEQYFGLDLVSEHAELTSWHSVECYESTAPGEGMATLNIVNFAPDDNIFVITINEDGAYREGSAQVPITPSVQIYGDEACTVRPVGVLRTVYAKVNRPLKWNETFPWNWQELTLMKPQEVEIPDIPYELRWYEDYISDAVPCPTVDSVFPAGVYELNLPQSYTVDTSDLEDIFY